MTPSEIEVQTKFPLDPCFAFLIAGPCDIHHFLVCFARSPFHKRHRVWADGIARAPWVNDDIAQWKSGPHGVSSSRSSLGGALTPTSERLMQKISVDASFPQLLRLGSPKAQTIYSDKILRLPVDKRRKLWRGMA
jgi:hypothetical protein